MREPSMNNVQKEEILHNCFQYLVKQGLENVSMRKMCEETGMAMSSVYYWFGSKEDAIIDAAEWGLQEVAGSLFEYIYKYIDNLQIIIITFSEVAMRYQKELRFIYQVATSREIGKSIRPLGNRLSSIYDRYSEIIAEHFECDKRKLIPYVYLFVSAVMDYVIWEDKQKMEIELNCIYSEIDKITKA